MPLTPKHEQRVERQTARKKNQSSAQGPAEAASFTYRRRASSCGESLGWEEQQPFLLAASETSAGAGTALAGTRGGSRPSMGAQGQEAGRQGPGTRTPASSGPGRNPTVAGAWAVSFSLCPEPYVRAFLGKQEVLPAKFSTQGVVQALFQHTRPGLNPRTQPVSCFRDPGSPPH